MKEFIVIFRVVVLQLICINEVQEKKSVLNQGPYNIMLFTNKCAYKREKVSVIISALHQRNLSCTVSYIYGDFVISLRKVPRI